MVHQFLEILKDNKVLTQLCEIYYQNTGMVISVHHPGAWSSTLKRNEATIAVSSNPRPPASASAWNAIGKHAQPPNGRADTTSTAAMQGSSTLPSPSCISGRRSAPYTRGRSCWKSRRANACGSSSTRSPFRTSPTNGSRRLSSASRSWRGADSCSTPDSSISWQTTSSRRKTRYGCRKRWSCRIVSCTAVKSNRSDWRRP